MTKFALSFGLAFAPSNRGSIPPPQAQSVQLLNVSYDPTRELYRDINARFAAAWQAQTKQQVDDPAKPRRIGQAGPLGDRRPAGRRRHPGARL